MLFSKTEIRILKLDNKAFIVISNSQFPAVRTGIQIVNLKKKIISIYWYIDTNVENNKKKIKLKVQKCLIDVSMKYIIHLHSTY